MASEMFSIPSVIPAMKSRRGPRKSIFPILILPHHKSLSTNENLKNLVEIPDSSFFVG